MNRRQSLKMIAGAASVTAGAAAGLVGRPNLVLAQTAPTFTLPPLGYAYEALEPHIDTATMGYHHKNHHNAFVNILNQQVAKFPDLAKKPIEHFLSNLAGVPEPVRVPVQRAGGGHWNHTFFWSIMTPGGAKEPTGELKTAIDGAFGSFDKMKEAVTQAGLTTFGSGWGWLVLDRNKKLAAVSTPNQDTPHMNLAAKPIIGVDVWEHAYYLKHQYRRADYLKAWWNTVNWDKAAENFKKATT